MDTIEIDQMQTILLSGMGKLPGTCLGLFSIAHIRQAKQQLLAWLQRFNPCGLRDPTKDRVIQIAFSANGLKALGIEARECDGFDRAFCEGMTTDFRQRTLGDLAHNSPVHWRWSDRDTHVAIWIYADKGKTASLYLNEIAGSADSGLKLLHSIQTDRLPGVNEHFGFRDGISNPQLPRYGQADPNALGVGDFVFGYKNALGEKVAGPMVGNHPLGKFGTYMAMRQLRQDVPGFWKQWLDAAHGDPEKAVWLASKAVGRWPNGMPVASVDPGPMPMLVESKVTSMDFQKDTNGYKCPFGSHIRRSNPRDDVPAGQLLKHRLFRRGRVYGPVCEADIYPAGLHVAPNHLGRENGADRGMLFVCLNTDIIRQFEFVQQTWINNPKFRGLHKEVDPVTGGQVKALDADVFTIPAKPFRHRVTGVQPHVQVCGGGYFFLPGKDGLKLLNSTFSMENCDKKT